MSTTFAQLGVPESICRALERDGIHEPFEIQTATMADAFAGRDICGRAPTGSGKTLAFGIPLVVNATDARSKRPTALVLSPTRELAEQIATELRTFAGDVRVGVVYGGVGYGPQLKRLRDGVEILVACPGRLEDLIEQGAVSLGDVDQAVIDEADRMSDMGFFPAVRRLLDQTSRDRQTFLFSATLDGDVKRLTRDYQYEPVTHAVDAETPDITVAAHRFWQVNKSERVAACVDVIHAAGQTIVFCRTRHGSDRLTHQLTQRGIRAAAIHGGHAQNRRTRSLQQFIDGNVQALVATDVAARGIHVDDVASVIHYDPPEDHKTYLHRSGRTARAGRGGLVVSLLQPDQMMDARRMQRRLGLDEAITLPDAGGLPTESGPASERFADVPVQAGRDSNGHAGRNGQSADNGREQSGQRARNGQGARGNQPARNGQGGRGGQPARNGRGSSGAPKGGGRGRNRGNRGRARSSGANR
ncbi:MAG: DEAD/DEAH box helicase [bacterium]|nr:DEAD/DEAH box helicase [bacterium]